MNSLKLLMLGVWVCAVTLVSGHFALTWRAATPPETETPLLEGIDYEETEILHVPVLADGQVQGYVAAQFVFTADARALRQMTVKPHPYVRDEALRTIYSNTKVDFTKLERIDIDGLVKTIRTNVNTRFGGEFIKDLMVKEFNYVRKEQLRS